MLPTLPPTLAAFRRVSWFIRSWWGVRPWALDHARTAKVDPDVEATIRNAWQLSRTWVWAITLLVPLTVANVYLLKQKIDLQTSWAALALLAGQVGGFFALKRSNETRAYLGEVRILLHEIGARSILSSAISYAREIRECDNADQLRRRAIAILSHLRDSRLFPKAIDAFSVWARDDSQNVWKIVAALGASEKTVSEFTQAVIAEETDGAGVVANLAATADDNPRYYQPSSDKAPNKWFKPNPDAGNQTETLAVFLLPDEQGIPVGAFAMTSARKDALEEAQDGPSERLALTIEQCSLTLVGVVRRAHELWTGTGS